jgi:hypothetical protein
MAKIQYAQQQAPPPQVEQEPELRAVKPEQLSLPELIRIMDVASELRKGQEIVEQQLNLDQIKVRLSERLLEAAKVSGERITAEQIEVAIEDYYDKLHSFEEPEWDWHVLLAHLYVHRLTIVKWGLAIGAVVGLWWGL